VAAAAVQHLLRVLLDLPVALEVVEDTPKLVAQEHLDKEIREVLVAQQVALLLTAVAVAAGQVL
jgi:PII-like signaling protein